MTPAALLKEALQLAQQLNFQIRQDCLAGHGGSCELRGKKIFFVDLDLSVEDQLEKLVETLRREPEVAKFSMSRELRDRLLYQ